MKVTIEVPDQHIDGALSEPHSRYWASSAQWRRNAKGEPSGFVVESEGKGGEPERHLLNAANLQRALELMPTAVPRDLPKLVTGMWDGETGDHLLQLMAFGEVRYG